jgi:hypothetical protein
MTIRTKIVINIFALLTLIVFIFVVGVILSGRYILVSENSDQVGNATSSPVLKNNLLFSDVGLPPEIVISNNPVFLAFVGTSSQDGEHGRFQKVSESDLSLVDISNIVSGDNPDDSAANNFFDANGQPQFFKSDPPYYGESISYSSDGHYALEISTSEPDSSASLWDLKDRKLYFITQCGTACSLRGGYWLASDKVIVFGISEDYDAAQDKFLEERFINIYDLSKNIKSVYSDKY